MNKKRLGIIFAVTVIIVLMAEVLWSRLSYRVQDDPFLELLAERDCTPYSVVAEPFIDIYESVFGAEHDLTDVERKFCGKNPIEVAQDDLKKGRAKSFYLTHDMSGIRLAYGGLGQIKEAGSNVKLIVQGDVNLAEGCVIDGQSGDTTYSNHPLKQRMAYYNYVIAISQETIGAAGKDCRPRMPQQANDYDTVRLAMVLQRIEGIQKKFSSGGSKEQKKTNIDQAGVKPCTPDWARAEEGVVYDENFSLKDELIASRFCDRDPVDLALQDLAAGKAATYINVSCFGNNPAGWMQSNDKEVIEQCGMPGMNYYQGRGHQDADRYNYAIALSPQVRAHSKIDCRPENPEAAAVYDAVEQRIISTYPDGKAGYEAAIEAARKQPKPAHAITNEPIFR
ncbi:MAG TPA: hypothetical protein VHP34_04835 [Alphaproteobacteria bacterium]|nr:hypothetical protein [Alphaproteobacteria bacterium]